MHIVNLASVDAWMEHVAETQQMGERAHCCDSALARFPPNDVQRTKNEDSRFHPSEKRDSNHHRRPTEQRNTSAGSVDHSDGVGSKAKPK